MTTPLSIHAIPASWLSSSPIAWCEVPYSNWLVEQKYSRSTARSYSHCLAHFARWITGRCGDVDDAFESLIAEFLSEHLPSCRCPRPVQRHRAQVRAALHQLRPSLQAAGISVGLLEPDVVTFELGQFDEFMCSARGLAINTRRQRKNIVRGLLHESLDSHGQLGVIDAALLRHFISEHLQRWSPASASVLATALRGYFRFRTTQGDEVAHLLPVIASPANWRLTSLPAVLAPEEVECVLDSFSPAVPSWRRAQAMAHCVARLGLRSNEVVGLALDDLDWDSGTVRICRNKSRRVDVLPMQESVGRTIAQYLQHERPQCKNRHVFVRHVAPVEKPIGPGVVGHAIRAAYRRCDLPYTRVHVLRHSLAARVLDGGGSLKEVADVLRHRDLSTTQVYAKVDVQRLSAVTMPWPGSDA